MYSAYGDGLFVRRVSPFRYLWITGYLLLPTAFRSLSRLSSALSAKASVLRPSLLDLADSSAPSLGRCSLELLALDYELSLCFFALRCLSDSRLPDFFFLMHDFHHTSLGCLNSFL